MLGHLLLLLPHIVSKPFFLSLLPRPTDFICCHICSTVQSTHCISKCCKCLSVSLYYSDGFLSPVLHDLILCRFSDISVHAEVMRTLFLYLPYHWSFGNTPSGDVALKTLIFILCFHLLILLHWLVSGLVFPFSNSCLLTFALTFPPLPLPSFLAMLLLW